MIVTRTEQIWVKSNNTLSWLCHLSKNLYNESNYRIRQEFFTAKKWLRYNSLYHKMKTSTNYQRLPAQTAQQVLRILDRNWVSFFLMQLKLGKEINQNLKVNQNLLAIKRKTASFYLFLQTNR